MSDGFDADEAAALATGEQVEQTAQTGAKADEFDIDAPAEHAAAEGTEPSSDYGSVDTLREMALSSSPDMPLEKVEDPWDPDAGGVTRMYRGLLKAFDFDGTPAIVDIAIGIPEIWVAFSQADPDGNGDDSETDDGGDVDFSEVAGA